MPLCIQAINIQLQINTYIRDIYTSKREEQTYSKYRLFSDVIGSINTGIFYIF